MYFGILTENPELMEHVPCTTHAYTTKIIKKLWCLYCGHGHLWHNTHGSSAIGGSFLQSSIHCEFTVWIPKSKPELMVHLWHVEEGLMHIAHHSGCKDCYQKAFMLCVLLEPHTTNPVVMVHVLWEAHVYEQHSLKMYCVGLIPVS